MFSLMLQRQIEKDSSFQYHFGCKQIKLVHVCFADDLLVRCHGDVNSVRVLKRALDEFSDCSGLLPNNSKPVFFGSLNDEEKQAILNVLPFANGTLPVKYLGVPLIAKRLSVKDCGSLLDKIKIKVKNWKNRTTKKDTLWVKWVHSVKLRGRNICEISADINDSWGWENLLQIRDLIKNNVRCVIRNVKDASLWSDNWYNMGPLFQYISQRDLYDVRLNGEMRVIDMISNGQWRWTTEWHMKFPMITQLEVLNLNTDTKDNFFEETGMDRIRTFQWVLADCALWTNSKNGEIMLLTDAVFAETSLDLGDITQYLSNAGNGNNIKSIIRRLAFVASIYSIWQERNGRIFRDNKRSCDELFKFIVEMIKNKLLGLIVKNSAAVREIEVKWNISCQKINSKSHRVLIYRPFNGKYLVSWSSSEVTVPTKVS
ncbi:hypothetical protein Tco_0929123 [Tanacetum coccineum]